MLEDDARTRPDHARRSGSATEYDAARFRPICARTRAFASAHDAFVLPGEIQAAGRGETRVAPRLVRRPYSAAYTSGVPRARRSAFKSSATRKATSIACSALSRGSQ